MPKWFLIWVEAGKLIVLPSPAISRYPFHRLGVKLEICANKKVFNSIKKFRLILYLAIEKAAPVTGFIDSCGRSVAKLYSVDSLKRWRIVRATDAKDNLFFRVKSDVLTHEKFSCLSKWIKSKTFFRSSDVGLLWVFDILDWHVYFVLIDMQYYLLILTKPIF